jgi:hypothetical protein
VYLETERLKRVRGHDFLLQSKPKRLETPGAISGGIMNQETTVILKSNVNETLKERGSRYGKFVDHARVVQELKAVCMNNQSREWDDDMAEAMDMILHKIGRIVTGDPAYADSWHDIAGYASLVDKRLCGEVV